MTAPRQLRLGAFMRPVSLHTAAWRYPGAFPDANFTRDIKRFAQKLESGKIDGFFMADHVAVLNMPLDALKRSATPTRSSRSPAVRARHGDEAYRSDGDGLHHL